MLYIPPTSGPKQMWEFLVMAGFCHLWITGFAELASPLYLLIKCNGPFKWGKEEQEAFDSIKQALLSVPALGLPNVIKQKLLK